MRCRQVLALRGGKVARQHIESRQRVVHHRHRTIIGKRIGRGQQLDRRFIKSRARIIERHIQPHLVIAGKRPSRQMTSPRIQRVQQQRFADQLLGFIRPPEAPEQDHRQAARVVVVGIEPQCFIERLGHDAEVMPLAIQLSRGL